MPGKFLKGLLSNIPVVGDIAGAVIGGIGARKERKHRMKLAEYQYSKELEMWNRQNAYNHPTAQMQRLEEAGINPHMVHGSGTVANTAGTQPKYNAPDVSYTRPQFNMPNVLGEYNRVRLQDAQVGAITQATRLSAQRQVNEAAKLLGIMSDSDRKRIQREVASATEQFTIDAKALQVEQARSRLGKTNQEIANLAVDNEMKKLRLQIEKSGKVGWVGSFVRNLEGQMLDMGMTPDQARIQLKSKFQEMIQKVDRFKGLGWPALERIFNLLLGGKPGNRNNR